MHRDFSAPDVPLVPLRHLDQLWFQLTGTVCNLACHHCFISCSPKNHAFGRLSRETVGAALDEAKRLGVKEFYFTGGEPFLHPDIVEILRETLAVGPATVLTNGTLFKDDALAELRRIEDASRYSLEFRVSIDGYSAEENDAIRGRGTFERILAGVRQLVSLGFLPIVTVALTRDDQAAETVFAGFVELLKSRGYARPRVKILPTLRLGAEVARQRGYHDDERVTAEMMRDFDVDSLLCSHARIVTDRGVHACPILIESPHALFGPTLAESLAPSQLSHAACSTCYFHGALCSNQASQDRSA